MGSRYKDPRTIDDPLARAAWASTLVPGATVRIRHTIWCRKAGRSNYKKHELRSHEVTLTIAKVTERFLVSTTGQRFALHTITPCSSHSEV